MTDTTDTRPHMPRGHLTIPAGQRVEHEKLPVFPTVDEAWEIQGKRGTLKIERVHDDLGDRCYVIQTTPGADNQATESVERLGYPVYSPTAIRWKQYRRHRHRRCERARPVRRRTKLMPGYVFVRIPEAMPPFGAICKCEGVRDFLYEDGAPGRLPSRTVAQIYARELEGAFDETLPDGMAGISAGEHVRLTSGPLRWFNGTVDAVDMDKLRAEIAVLMLGTRIMVTMSLDEIERVE